MSDTAYRGQSSSESLGGYGAESGLRLSRSCGQLQRRVNRQAGRYVAQLTDAEQMAVRLECGEVAGVFSGQAGGSARRGAFVVGCSFRWRRSPS